MKLRVTSIDRTAGDQPTDGVWDLKQENLTGSEPLSRRLWGYYLLFANGLDWQTRIVGDTPEALDVARGLARGAGSCQRVEPGKCLTSELKEGTCLYREGDECYLQGEVATGSYACLFIDPRPQPDLCIFCNRFRPVAINPAWWAWNDGTVKKIAQAIYDERAFDRMPILADALEEAGCTNQDILTHCRSGREHVRGCWAVDLILGRL
jgi:hypothetical protein